MVEECVNYLKSLDRIIIPEEYTYLVHCAAFRPQVIAEKDKYNKAWTSLPLNGFVVKRELSCIERKDRVWSAIQMGGLNCAMTNYAKSEDSKPFQIRIIIPHRRLSEEEQSKLGIDSEYLQNLEKTHSGMDQRHPKIMKGERIIIFATSCFDEITGTYEDIFYGVREQDLLKYTQLVLEEYKKNPNIDPEYIPKNRDEYKLWLDSTFALAKNQNDYRYCNGTVKDATGQPTAIKYSEFEQEYWQNLANNNHDYAQK